MTSEQFTYWLQGFAELNGDAPPTKEQWDSIREHLALQFHKVTPPVVSPAVVPKIDYQKAMREGGIAQHLPNETRVMC